LPGRQFHFFIIMLSELTTNTPVADMRPADQKASSPCMQRCKTTAPFPATREALHSQALHVTVLSHHLLAGSLVACHDRRASPRLSCSEHPSVMQKGLRLVGETPHSLVLPADCNIIYANTITYTASSLIPLIVFLC
jgi:hypothetical protein